MLGKKIQYFLMTGTVMIPIDFFFFKRVSTFKINTIRQENRLGLADNKY